MRWYCLPSMYTGCHLISALYALLCLSALALCAQRLMFDLFFMGSATSLGNSLLRSIILLYFHLSTQGLLTHHSHFSAGQWHQLHGFKVGHCCTQSILLAQHSYTCKRKVNKCYSRWKMTIFIEILNSDEDEWLLYTASEIVNKPMNGDRGSCCEHGRTANAGRTSGLGKHSQANLTQDWFR